MNEQNERMNMEGLEEKYNLNTQMIAMPMKVRGAVTINEDDSYTIFINKNISAEMQRQTFLHELRHIRNGDLFSEESADEIEARNHALDIDLE